MDHIPPGAQRRLLDVALAAIDAELVGTPFAAVLRPLDRLELPDVFGTLAFSRYLDRAEDEAGASEEPPYVHLPPRAG